MSLCLCLSVSVGGYCEKLVKLRQREKQHWQRLEATEAQLQEREQQVKELQQVLRRLDSNATKVSPRELATFV